MRCEAIARYSHNFSTISCSLIMTQLYKESKIKSRIIIILLMSTMALGQGITSFSAGETSPLLSGRTDLQKYYSGVRDCKNLVCLPQGPLTKRPGTKYIAATKTASLTIRVIPFEFSTDQAYIVEMGNEYMRFYANSAQIDTSSEIATPYQTADLFEIQYIQSADTMYLVHNNYAPRVLTRTSSTSWTLTAVTFEHGPFMAENTTTTTITPSATTGTITLTASTSIFDANHVGAQWQVSHVDEANSVSGDFTDANTSDELTIQKGRRYNWLTSGKWVGSLSLQRSYDDGDTWNDVKMHIMKAEVPNISYADTEGVAPAVYRVNMSSFTSGTCTYDLTELSYTVDGVVTITDYNDVNMVTATVDDALGGTDAVTAWAEGSFSADNGYPGAVAFYDERLALAGTDEESQVVWMSQTNDWENFQTGFLATDSLRYEIASDKVNKIRWLSPQRALLIGTVGSEWKLSAASADASLGIDNFDAKRQSTYGSDSQMPLAVGNKVFFVPRQAKKIRQLSYEWAQDNYIAPDVTLLSEHLTKSGVKQIALQKTPYTILWVVNNDGDLLSLTFEEFEEVIGWSVHTFDGDVESVAVIPGDGEDEVWLSVERVIDSNTVRYVEQMQTFDWGDRRDAFFVDCGLSFDGGAAVTVSGITLADPAVVTTSGVHGFSDGDNIRFSDITGMTDANDRVYSVGTLPTTSSFQLRDYADTMDINSVNFTAMTGTGSVEVVENSFTDANHLALKSVVACGDGGDAGSGTISATGTITLDDSYNTAHIGLSIESKLKHQRLEFTSTGCQLQGMTKRITAVTTRFYDTLGCSIGPSYTKYTEIVFRESEDLLDAPTPLYTGDKRVLFTGSWGTDGDICIQQSLPLPFTVLSLPRIEFVANP